MAQHELMSPPTRTAPMDICFNIRMPFVSRQRGNRTASLMYNIAIQARHTLTDVKGKPGHSAYQGQCFTNAKFRQHFSRGELIMTDLVVKPDLWVTRMLPEGTVEKWLVADGAKVASEEPVVDVRIENQLRRLKSPDTGRLYTFYRIASWNPAR